MRKSFLGLLLFVFFTSKAQEPEDSLSKYSYMVQMSREGIKSQATGCFVRHEGRLFFISTAHLLTGFDPVQFRAIDNYPDTVFIRLSNDTSKLQFLPLPILSMKRKSKPFHEYESPDVYVVEIKDAKKYSVYSIESFFDEELRCEQAKTVLVYGYSNGQEGNDYLRDRQQTSNSRSALTQEYCLHVFLPNVKLNDAVNYYTYLKSGDAGTGLSGAPAYLLTQDNTIVFGGLYIGGLSDPSKTGIVVRPEYVINKVLARIFNE